MWKKEQRPVVRETPICYKPVRPIVAFLDLWNRCVLKLEKYYYVDVLRHGMPVHDDGWVPYKVKIVELNLYCFVRYDTNEFSFDTRVSVLQLSDAQSDEDLSACLCMHSIRTNRVVFWP